MSGGSQAQVPEAYALEGRVVTMDPARTVLERGIVVVRGGRIAHVRPLGDPVPAGMEAIPLFRTGGTIFPGLIELHNHLSYNILPLWQVPRRFDNRGQWQGHPDKRRLITGPMQVLGKTPRYVPAIARYVEAKCLVSGVTTSQGLALYGVGIQPFYRGLVRNVEHTGVADLPPATTRIADLEATQAQRFLQRLEASSCLLLHLSEGSDPASLRNFQALQVAEGRWAITPALAGIHCVPLAAAEWQTMAAHGGAFVWSPLSNYLLYGQTADVRAAREAGLLIGLGADWSPSGSKNVLCELKVARLASRLLGDVFDDEELVAMVTSNAARILKWDGSLGSLEAGKRADLLVIGGRRGDPYARLLEARETAVELVVIDGVPRYGQPGLMRALGVGTETWRLGRTQRLLNLGGDADPLVEGLTLAEACRLLQQGLDNLAELAADLEEGATPEALLARLGQRFDGPDAARQALTAHGLALGQAGEGLLETWTEAGRQSPMAFLDLEQDDLAGQALRPHLPLAGGGDLTGFPAPLEAAGMPYSQLLANVRIELDPLTLAGDDLFFRRLAQQPNLPAAIKAQLPPMYGIDPLPEDAQFVRKLHPAVQSKFDTALDLGAFTRTAGLLSLADRQCIVEQALLLLERLYVHLPLKRAMHAVDPIQRLKLLQYQLEQEDPQNLTSELHFHNEMTSIFTSARDLHTNYLLPRPFREMTAFLPFLVEEYFEGGQPRYIISKVVGDHHARGLEQGAEVLYWNGVPIRRAVELNAERQAGSNPDARHARGMDSLTIRPLVRMLPPDEEWVTLRCRTEAGEMVDITERWLVFPPGTALGGVDPDGARVEAAALALDLQTDVIQQVKKVLYAPWAVEAEHDLILETTVRAEPPDGLPTSMPQLFRAKAVDTTRGPLGYVRIFSFDIDDAEAFVEEFVRLVRLLPQEGLIVDVRDNPGGLIYAAERLLQVLTPNWIEPERAQFINTPLALDICRRHGPSPLWRDFDLSPWIESIAQAVQTGATYSLGFAITPPALCNDRGQEYYGPVVLITDGLSYSAADMFAAGFQDHDVGPIVGTSGHTGAGGANVWTHSLLQILMGDAERPGQPRPGSPFRPLPHGAGMRVAVRRTLRTGERSGVPLEDLGVVPDRVHHLTRRDLLEGNLDLIDAAAETLAGRPAYHLAVEELARDGGTLRGRAVTHNVEWLDVYLEGRPQGSLDMSDDTEDFALQVPERLVDEIDLRLELFAFSGGKAVAMRRLTVPPG